MTGREARAWPLPPVAVPAAEPEPWPGPRPLLDPDSRAWIAALSGTGATREQAVARLHALLVRAARFQLSRRASRLRLRGESVADLATEAADDALVSVLAHLHDFRGASRFTTWASKFAILEASVVLRRRVWKEREVTLDGDAFFEATPALADEEKREHRELLESLRVAVAEVLSDRQREVFVAVALNGVPIDLVADRLGATRGAVYKMLHDARRKLRTHLELPGGAATL
ncbi:MAG TPA: sigma-70 family RNA polymerase sigma factor [Gaiellaceae bacterium]|nr:sigma-70 family RNA polymerase sigma factor [Gaiellaceae bacterium]